MPRRPAPPTTLRPPARREYDDGGMGPAERCRRRRDASRRGVRPTISLDINVALRRRADHADTPARPRGPVLELRRHERESGVDL